MANGRFGRVVMAGLAAMAAAGAGYARAALPTVDKGPLRNAHHGERLDLNISAWSYKRKGKRTAAQQKRAALKKRNKK